MKKRIIFQKMIHKEYSVYVGVIDINSLKGLYISKPLKEEEDSLYVEDGESKITEESIQHSDFLKVNQKILVQRDKIPSKIRQIAKYIASESGLGFFPNSIILGNQKISEAPIKFKNIVEFGENFFELSLPDRLLNDDEKLFIIDGQHRIEGAFRYYYEEVISTLRTTLEINNEKDVVKQIDELVSTKHDGVINEFGQILKDSTREFKNILRSFFQDSLSIDTEEILDFIEKQGYKELTTKILENVEINIIKLGEFLFGKIGRIEQIISILKKQSDIQVKDICINFSVIIFDGVTKSKMIEIFTDINSSATRLNTNTTRYFYGRLTTKEPFLTISVNIGKILNETTNSVLKGFIKMPYKYKFAQKSQVSISAFCQRFSEYGEIALESKKRIDKVDFYTKPFGVIIFYEYLVKLQNNNDKVLKMYDKSSIETSIVFFSRFFSNAYTKYKETFDKVVGEDKNAKFIDSSSNQLYMFISKELLINIINNGFDLRKLVDIGSDDSKIEQLKKIVFESYSDQIEDSLRDVVKKYDGFRKGSKKNAGTGGQKSLEIVNTFRLYYYNRLGLINSTELNDENLNFIKTKIEKNFRENFNDKIATSL